MNTRILFSFCFLWCCYSAHGQSVSGVIHDGSDRAPLAYVNIGILGKGVGTVSGRDGRFSIPLDPQYDRDTLRISCVGYATRDFPVADFRRQIAASPEVLLSPLDILLPEVAVSNRKWKRIILGNETKPTTSANAGFSSKYLGTEIGLRLKISRKTYFRTFHTRIMENHYDVLKFRLNIYSVKKGLPDQHITGHNIIIETTPGQTGALSVDLTPYNLVYDDDVILTLEWIEGAGDGRLYFPAKLMGSAFLARETSQADWEKVGVVGIGFWVEADR